MKFSIRLAMQKDLEGVLSILQHLHRSEEIPPINLDTKDTWSQLIEDKRLHCFVAESESCDIIATVTLDIVPNLTRGCRPFGVVQNVVTHADFRGQGIGTAVMKHVIQKCWQLNCYQILVQTGRDEVVPWYKELGFRQDKVGLAIKPEWTAT